MLDFLTRVVEDRVSWNRIDRRHISQGIYLPGRDGRGLGRGLIMVDTSGSISGPVLGSFAACVHGIFREFPDSEVLIGYCDCRMQGTPEVWDGEQGAFVMKPRGGGGTSHVPVFNWVDEQVEAGEEIDWVICLTDLVTDFPQGSDVPTLWVVYGNKSAKAPFGRTIHIPEEG
jgi:predicted metal-dependent peptidase